jgi:hypothetical protein
MAPKKLLVAMCTFLVGYPQGIPGGFWGPSGGGKGHGHPSVGTQNEARYKP